MAATLVFAATVGVTVELLPGLSAHGKKRLNTDLCAEVLAVLDELQLDDDELRADGEQLADRVLDAISDTHPLLAAHRI